MAPSLLLLGAYWHRGCLPLAFPCFLCPAFCPTPLLFPEQTTTQAHISSCCFRLLRVLVPHRSRVSPEQAGQKEKSDLLFTAELCCFDENLVVEPNSTRCDITSQLLAVSSDLLPHPSSLGSVPPAVDRLLYFVSPLPRCWFQNHHSTILLPEAVGMATPSGNLRNLLYPNHNRRRPLPHQRAYPQHLPHTSNPSIREGKALCAQSPV